MAVSPQTLERNLIEESKRFESKIDKRLTDCKVNKGGTLSINVPSGMEFIHFSYIKKLYENAG